MFLDMSEEQAQSEFKKLIKQAVNEWYRKYDNWFHNYKDHTKGQKWLCGTKANSRSNELSIFDEFDFENNFE